METLLNLPLCLMLGTAGVHLPGTHEEVAACNSTPACIADSVAGWQRRGPGWNALAGQSLSLTEPGLPLGVTTGRYGPVKWISVGDGASCLAKE